MTSLQFDIGAEPLAPIDTLEQYFADRRNDSFDFHFGDIRTR